MNQKIEKYLTNRMKDKEKAAFEQDIANNPVIAKQVNEYKIAIEGIRQEGRARLKQRLQRLEGPNKMANTKKQLSKQWIGYLGAGILLAAALFFLVFQEKTETNQPVEINKEFVPLKVEKVPVQIDSIALRKQSTFQEEISNKVNPAKKQNSFKKTQPIAKKKPHSISNKMLFAQTFKPYRHPSMSPNIRGAGDLTMREKFELAYWEENYTQVLVLWDSLSIGQRENGNLLFLYAVATMEQGRVGEAQKDFEQLVKMKRHRFVQPSEWYLALAALHENEVEKAKKILLQISENSNHPLNQEAVNLLKTIE